MPLSVRRAALATLLVGLVPVLPATAPAQSLLGSPASGGGSAGATDDGTSLSVEMFATARGRSGALRVVFMTPDQEIGGATSAELMYRWERMFDTPNQVLGEPAFTSAPLRAPSAPGIWRLELGEQGSSPLDMAVITPVPFELKVDGFLNGYHIGRYPTEGSGRTDEYAPPQAFIQVTQANQDLQISEHFRIKDFLTKDQFDVWPKYVALDLQLIDKLELVLKELNAMGIRADRLAVMSGFRTPQYNGPGGDGRATLSRHTYGDAADVWVDSDEDGYMDDLNGDGRQDYEDTYVLLRAVDRVERAHPELMGGAGQYASNSAHGPFVHIDARGSHARW